MKFIKKGESPDEFERWKAQDEPTSWSQLGSTLPSKKDEGLVYYSKNQLRTVLYNEQHGLCCYCNTKIDDDHKTTSIDHVEPRIGDKITKRIFEYNNLLLSCDRRIEKLNPKDYYCDPKKDVNPIDLTPLMSECETEIYFNENGKINANTDRATRTISVLNLHHISLDIKRRAAIIPYLYSDVENDNPEEILPADEIIQSFEMLQKNHHIEYWSAIVSVLRGYV